MQEISEQYPAFAGFAYESPGSDILVIGVKGPENVLETLRGAVDLLIRKHVIANGSPAVARLVNYTFLELDAWRDAVEAPLFALSEVTMLDLDELNNKLIVGVRPTASRVRVVALMREANIPDAAYRFKDWHPVCSGGCLHEMEYSGVPPQANTLQAYQRPAYAGRRITFRRGAKVFACTLTFTGYAWNYGNTLGIVTNSHCSTRLGELDGNTYWQPDSATQLQMAPQTLFAAETVDPPFTGTGAERRQSDALFASASDPAHQSINRRIARPTGLGSITIDANRPFFTIVDTDGPTMNGRQDKVGFVTGWTQGTALHTCISMPYSRPAPDGSAVTLNCQAAATLSSADGDSGAPVFRFFENQNIGGTNVTLVGIHYGRDTANNAALFSSWHGLERDLGPVFFSPAPAQ